MLYDMQCSLRPNLDAPVPVISKAFPDRTATLAFTRIDPVTQIRVGETVYYLRPGAVGFYDLVTALYRVSGIPYEAMGLTEAQAKDEWMRRFHVRFQELYAKPDFEKTPEEKQEWEALTAVVDLNDYTNRTPTRARVIGQLIRKRGHVRVRFLHGGGTRIPFELAPADLLGLPLGRWFEADGDYDPRTGHLQRLYAVRPTAAPERAGTARVRDFLASIPDTSRCPDADGQ